MDQGDERVGGDERLERTVERLVSGLLVYMVVGRGEEGTE